MKFKLKENKNVILIIVCGILIVGMLIYGLFGNRQNDPMKNYISFGLVSKDVSLIFNSTEEIDAKKSNYFNENVDEWYVPFMNTMYEMGFFTTKDVYATEAAVNEVFTYGDLDKLYTNMGVTDKELIAFY